VKFGAVLEEMSGISYILYFSVTSAFVFHTLIKPKQEPFIFYYFSTVYNYFKINIWTSLNPLKPSGNYMSHLL
jgi:hypothetical protein